MRQTGTEELDGGTAQPAEAELADPGLAEFAAAGNPAVGEFRCAECGYGAVVQRTLPPCPMCGGTVWEQSTWSRFRLPPDEPLQ